MYHSPRSQDTFRSPNLATTGTIPTATQGTKTEKYGTEIDADEANDSIRNSVGLPTRKETSVLLLDC